MSRCKLTLISLLKVFEVSVTLFLAAEYRAPRPAKEIALVPIAGYCGRCTTV